MTPKKKNPWIWLPSLYFAEGMPYIVVMTVSVIMYKRMGISNTDIALYTSWLYLPWVIKPLWGPLVDIVKTKRWWIVTMQLLIGAGLAGVAFAIPVQPFFQYTLAFFWLIAFSSATHDISADGFYMLGLSTHDQAWFVGIRSTFYRFAMITGQGLLVILAGFIEENSGLESIQLRVQAAPGIEDSRFIQPDSLPPMPSVSRQAIIAYPAELNIAAHPVSRAETDARIKTILNWNNSHGHITHTNAQDRINGTDNGDSSFWQSAIVMPLESFLRNWFGANNVGRTDNLTGNYGVVYFRLAQSPAKDETVVINFGRSHGDKNISLIGTGRFIFDQSNWSVPAMALLQIDPKLKYKTSAMFKIQSGNITLAWGVTFFILAALFLIFALYHRFALPYPAEDKSKPIPNFKIFIKDFFETFALFFKKKQIGRILAFLLLYRFAESQIVKLASPFLLDSQEVGGLALTTGDVGFVYGTVGLLSLTLGGLLGGFVAARDGLKRWILPMAIAINLPDVVYVLLAYTQVDKLLWVNIAVAVEQFGYGFGFTAYMLYMIYVSEGDHKTAHFALTTAFMALGMMIPGMFSGWLQDIIGYQHFFVWVMLATIPAIAIIRIAPLDANFGKRTDKV